MIKETATVVAIDGDTIVVEAAIKSTCNSCQSQSNCGTGVISRALAPKTQQLALTSPMPVRIGQQVTVGIPEEGILTASAWLYLLPLVVFILGFSVSSYVMPLLSLTHELWAMLPSSLLTLIAYRTIASRLATLDKSKFQPVLLIGPTTP